MVNNINWKNMLGFGVFAFTIIVLAQMMVLWLTIGKSNNVSRFNLSSEKIVKDLDGKVVGLVLNQVWPFDSSQSITVQVVSKKQLDEYVIVVVDIKSLAAVQQDVPKEQFSTTTNSKEVPKPPIKLPSKLQLIGRMKLTYELVEGDWYLLNLDNLNLKAIPID